MGHESHDVREAAASSHPFDAVPDPDPDWVQANPERALRFLFLFPRPCDGLDRLLGDHIASEDRATRAVAPRYG
ncbi:hypothetical protein [Sphingomonas solaris]|uniref:Uncharacterized protein n=1 Tax=Alterirhizorhabdus solaris TaxID=2529389 RepID=A0A558R597_9SPHN|nr:hypothetical protein [Sphingomonas solaris]TVV74512.1 hypothetical protein FOY91_09615 [Sphingomonas solaris]